VIVPDDQLSLAIGREGQNARLAAKLTGWKVDIKSETEFSQEEEELGYEEGEEVDGRCAAVLSAGRRCPNASLAGSRYCGLPQHQALARFDTNQVTVLSGLGDDEISKLADSNASEAEVRPLVERATAEVEQGRDEEPEGETAPDAGEAAPEAVAENAAAEGDAEASDAEEAERELEEAKGEAARDVAEAERELTEAEEAGVQSAESDEGEAETRDAEEGEEPATDEVEGHARPEEALAEDA
jgi:transcription termination/antitermination protein NusA